MARIRTFATVVASVIGAAAITGRVAAALASSGSSSPLPSENGTTSLIWHRSKMRRLSGDAMTGGFPPGWMRDRSRYGGMNGALGRVPGWMHGGVLPGDVLGLATDTGRVTDRISVMRLANGRVPLKLRTSAMRSPMGRKSTGRTIASRSRPTTYASRSLRA